MFNNAGIFRKSTGDGTTTIDVAFNNTGTADAQAGTLSFTRGFTQTAGATVLSGGGLVSTTTLDIQGGSLSGSGTVTGDVSSAGQVGPGSSSGILNINGNYTQVTGDLNIEIGGLTTGDEFDQLNISSLATLAGTLNISLINGFGPTLGNTFVILTYGSLVGTFDTINGLDIGGGLVFQVTYGTTSLTLEVVSP